jgi:hypothetical protein
MSYHLRFQRRLSLGPVHLNFCKTGMGCSVGVRGARFGITSGGRHYSAIGIPGTGVSWRSYQSDDHRSQGFHVAWWAWPIIVAAIFWACSWGSP